MRKFGSIQRVMFTLPVIVFMLVFLAYPIAYSFIISMTKFDGISSPVFSGFKNYIDLFYSDEFRRVAFNNLYCAIIGIPLSIILPLIVSVLMFEEVKGHKIFKVAFLLPSALSVVIVGIMFRTFFGYEGLINKILSIIGLGGNPIDWLAQGSTSIPVIVLAMVWSTFGVNAIILLAGMSTIPQSVYESADMDGFNWLQKTFFITIPMIINVFEFVTVISIVNVFSSMFGFVYTITSGGPGYESSFMEYLIFIKGFQLNNFGYASAISVILFIVMLILTQLTMKLFKEDWI